MKFDPTMPRFEIGQTVELQSKYQHRYGLAGGLIVGMVWTSRDAAIAGSSEIGWTYVLEVDPLTHGYNAHFELPEDKLNLVEVPNEHP